MYRLRLYVPIPYQVKGNSVIITFSGFGGQEQKLSKVETVVYVECQRIGDSWLDEIRGKCCPWYPVSSNKPVCCCLFFSLRGWKLLVPYLSTVIGILWCGRFYLLAISAHFLLTYTYSKECSVFGPCCLLFIELRSGRPDLGSQLLHRYVVYTFPNLEVVFHSLPYWFSLGRGDAICCDSFLSLSFWLLGLLWRHNRDITA